MFDLNTPKIRKDIEAIQGSGFDTDQDSLVHAGLKSVQRGTVNLATALSVDVTITAVNMDKAYLSFSYYTDTDDAKANLVRGRIVSSTTVTFDHGNNVGTLYIAWQVIEWK